MQVGRASVCHCWDQIATGASFAFLTELSIKAPPPHFSLWENPSVCQRTRAPWTQQCSSHNTNQRWGGKKKAFSMACRVRSRALADYGGCHHLHTRRERVRKRNGAAGCCTTGTGSLSGNSHTCHHSCALLKSVRQRCLCSAGTPQKELQQHLEQQWWQQLILQTDGWSRTGLPSL